MSFSLHLWRRMSAVSCNTSKKSGKWKWLWAASEPRAFGQRSHIESGSAIFTSSSCLTLTCHLTEVRDVIHQNVSLSSSFCFLYLPCDCLRSLFIKFVNRRWTENRYPYYQHPGWETCKKIIGNQTGKSSRRTFRNQSSQWYTRESKHFELCNSFTVIILDFVIVYIISHSFNVLNTCSCFPSLFFVNL